VKRELERIEIPGEHEARERTWAVVHAAFDAREPTPRRSQWPRVAVVAIALAALAAAALSSPGRAVLDEVREVVGVERAQPALFSLPTEGRLLVSSDAGVWVVQEDGSKRLLGPYREASWSPFGRFVVAARENELAALEPDGGVRWTLPRPRVRSPRWAGNETDTKIAYLGRQPRVVAGDGTGDGPVCAVSARTVAPAWKPGAGYVLALVAPSGRPYVVDLDGCVVRWSAARIARPERLEWSTDGTRLLVVGATRLLILDARTGRLVASTPGGVDGAFRPGTRTLARIFQRGNRGRILIGGRGVVFSAPGRLEMPMWSPDGRWLLASWPAADQWVFVRADGRQIRAVSNVSEQFRSRSFPRVEGWCCTR
jgi:hypothetical protein